MQTFRQMSFAAFDHQPGDRQGPLAGSGDLRAMPGSWQLLPSTIPLIIAAKVVNIRALFPFASVGYICRIAIRMVRYTRRLSLMGSLLFFLGWKKHSVHYVAVVIGLSVR